MNITEQCTSYIDGAIGEIGPILDITPKFKKRVITILMHDGKKAQQWNVDLTYERMELPEQMGLVPGSQVRVLLTHSSVKNERFDNPFINNVVKEIAILGAAAPAPAAAAPAAAPVAAAPAAATPFG